MSCEGVLLGLGHPIEAETLEEDEDRYPEAKNIDVAVLELLEGRRRRCIHPDPENETLVRFDHDGFAAGKCFFACALSETRLIHNHTGLIFEIKVPKLIRFPIHFIH